MTNITEQLIKAFKHIAREIQVYILSGSLILFELFFIDYFYYEQSIFNYWKEFPYLFIILLLFSYTFGHLTYALMYVVFEKTKVESKIKKILKYSIDNKIEDILNKEVAIFNENTNAYYEYIERYNILNHMRWNLSGANFLMFLINLIYLIFNKCCYQVVIVFAINFLGFFVFLLLSLKTEEEYYKRIEVISSRSSLK